MNRRRFLEALAGVPLLGLLVKMPETEKEASYTWGDPRELCIGYADNAGEGSLSFGGDYCYAGDKEPYLRYWSAQDSEEPIVRY